MERLKNWLTALRWAIFEHNPFGKICLVDSKGTKLYLRPEVHFRLTGGRIDVRLDCREDVEDFCRRFDCKLL